MNQFMQERLPTALAVILALLLTSGCQGMAGSKPAVVSIEQMMPGKEASTRYEHMLAAIQSLDAALSAKKASLDAVPLDAVLTAHLSSGTDNEVDQSNTVKRIAENNLLDAAPYQLVVADTLSGRLEYRSEATGAHLSVNVRAPDTREHDSGLRFVVTDLFGQVSLAELLRGQTDDGMAQAGSGSPFVKVSVLRQAGHTRVNDDAGKLAYFDTLPRVEREREDILGLRALLLMRLDKHQQALPLVEKGIIRYPHSPLFFNMAAVLFERKKPGGDSQPDYLSKVMQQRFSGREVMANRQQLERYLRADVPL